MSDNLSKRIFTSIILFAVLIICIFINKYTFLFLVTVASVISFFEFINLSKKIWKKKDYKIYLAYLISFFYLLFFSYSTYEIYKIGLSKIIFILLICIFSDIGGYFIGKLIGGKRLIKISPNKTISGSIGSFVFSLIPIITFLTIYEFTKNNEFQIHNHEFYNTIFLCLGTSLMCQLGDLFISYFKRKAKIKDTGSILPGHGGLLDRVDGIIIAIPTVFFVYKMIF